MTKRIIICCDGTGNEIDDHHSNVLKFCRTLKKTDDQLVYYDPGLGTLGAHDEWSRVKQKTEKIFGLALGYGLDRNVLDAYKFLIHNFEKGDGLYFYGFSRGAYTVRVLAGLINAIGIIRPEQSNLSSFAYTAYKQIEETSDFESIRLYEKTLRPEHPPILFLGLWDTVSSIIVPRKDRLLIPSLKQLAFTAKNPSVISVRHALALDEKRRMFRPYHWSIDSEAWGNPFKVGDPFKQDVKEVWFSGAHSDIGGGYSEHESGLAKIPLHWMITESPEELEFVSQTVNQVVLGEPRKGSPHYYAKPNHLDKLHDSLTTGWRPFEWLPKRVTMMEWPQRDSFLGFYLPRGEPRHLKSNAIIHETVYKRRSGREDYNPLNVPAVAN